MNVIPNKLLRSQKTALSLSAIGLAVFVALNAMGAHALKDVLESPEMNRIYSAALRHLMLGCLEVFIMTIVSHLFSLNPKVPLILLALGILFFSVNLLVYFFLKVQGISLPLLGAVAPLGGTLLIASWVWFGVLIAKAPVSK